MSHRPPPEAIHWFRTACPAPRCEVFDGSLSVDVLVVGGGLTGCRTALGLAEAGVSVALVDAKAIGFGASGRSGGQCNPIWRATPAQLIDKLGKPHGETLIRTTLTAARDLFGDIDRFDVDCDAEQNGWVQAAHTKAAARTMQALGRAWAEAGADIAELTGPDVEAACGSPAYGFALKHAAGGNVQPLSLTRGYARAAQARGAHLFEDCTITALERQGHRWIATTARGAISAEKVVLTTNAYTDRLWPNLKKTFHPLVSIALATRPLTDAEQQTVLPGRVTISDSRLAIFYARLDRDNRLIFGCVGSNDRAGSFGGYRRLRAGLRTVFPQIADIEAERMWCGRIAVTPDMLPRLFEPAPGLLAGLGFSGRGIAMTSVMGRALAARASGAAAEDLPFPVSEVEPIPYHDLSRLLIPFAAPALTIKDRVDAAISPS